MKRRRHKLVPQLPPAPRIEPRARRAEQELHDTIFDPALWSRPTPL